MTRINKNEIDIADKVKQAIIDELDDNMTILQDGDSLKDELGLDELDLTQIAINIEDEFPITISDAEMDGYKTVGDIINAVIEKVKP